jgi:hypothetical protein
VASVVGSLAEIERRNPRAPGALALTMRVRSRCAWIRHEPEPNPLLYRCVRLRDKRPRLKKALEFNNAPVAQWIERPPPKR